MLDLEAIKRAFVAVLQGIFHPRITYPENIVLPGEKAQSNQVSSVNSQNVINPKKGWASEDDGETRQPRTGLGRSS
jgi:hypothetical protein